MGQKSKAASLTGELLAPKGAAEPAAQPSGAGNRSAGSKSDSSSQTAASNGGSVQFPLRLDPSEHLELRMAAARSGRSCQELIVEALARYLAEIATESGDSEPPAAGGPE